MANPLKILTVLTASQAAKFEQGVELSGAVVARAGVTVTQGNVSVNGNVSGSGTLQAGGALTVVGVANLNGGAALNNQKISGLANGTVSTDAVAYGQLTDVSGALKTYIDAQDAADAIAWAAADTALSGALKTYIDAQDTADAIAWAAADTALSGALKTYVDAQDAAVSGALKTYVDAQDAAVSGALKTYVDAQDTALSGALKTYVDAQDTALSGALKTYVDAQDTALSGALKTYIDAQDTALSSSVSSSLVAERDARVAEDLTFLKLNGSRAMSGSLDMGNNNIVNASSGAFAGDVGVGGNLTVVGDLRVSGSLTYISSSELQIRDALITVAKGSPDAAAANGAGIEVDGANASITYDAAGNRWEMNKDLEVSGAFYADGQKLLEKASILDAVGAKLGYSTYGYVGIADFTYGEGVVIGGAEAVAVLTPNLTVEATSSFVKNATFQAQVAMDAALKLSGSAFTYIGTPIVSDKYDVNDAIRALDQAVSSSVTNGGGALATLKSNYDALRQVITGTLDGAGHADFTLAGAQFVAGEIDNVALDVMIDTGSGYTNDLVALKMSVFGAAIKIEIDAPGAVGADYRLIAVNEADGKL